MKKLFFGSCFVFVSELVRRFAPRNNKTFLVATFLVAKSGKVNYATKKYTCTYIPTA